MYVICAAMEKKAKSEEFMIMNICGGRKRKVFSGLSLGKARLPPQNTQSEQTSERLSQLRPFIDVPNSKTVSVPPRWMSPMIRETVEGRAGGRGGGGGGPLAVFEEV